jgi:hypothetical protein
MSDNAFFRTSVVLDAKVLRTGKHCKLVLTSIQTRRSVSRSFLSWPDLRHTLARFVTNERLGLAEIKLGGPELEASHTFVSVPFPRLQLQALGFPIDDLNAGPGQQSIDFKQALAR